MVRRRALELAQDHILKSMLGSIAKPETSPLLSGTEDGEAVNLVQRYYEQV